MSPRRPTPRRPWGGIAALMLIGMVAGAWAVAASPLFHIRDVEVRGIRHLSESEVVRLAGIGNRTNLLTLPAERVERALGGNPWIRSVQAHRSLPSTLVLTIDERVPVAWAQAPKGVAVVAADGTVLVRRKHPPKGLVAVGSSARSLAPGDTLEGLDEPLAAAASLAPPVRRVVRSAQLQRGELVLRLVGGTRVRYGEPRAVAEKSAALAKVLRWAAEQAIDLAYVDLTVAGNPAVRARGSGAPS